MPKARPGGVALYNHCYMRLTGPATLTFEMALNNLMTALEVVKESSTVMTPNQRYRARSAPPACGLVETTRHAAFSNPHTGRWTQIAQARRGLAQRGATLKPFT